VDAILRDLEQMLTVEGGPCVRRDVDRAQGSAALGLQRLQFVPGGEPDLLAVVRDAPHLVDARKGSVLAHDFG
jgi:hypothetical protein